MSNMLDLAGSVWRGLQHNKIYGTALRAISASEKQNELDIQTLTDCTVCETTPLYRRVLVEPLVLSAANRVSAEGFKWRVSDKLVRVMVITDNIAAPKVVLFNGYDFRIKQGVITFASDPSKQGFAEDQVLDDQGAAIGTEYTMWCNNLDYDENYVADIWGAPFDLSGPSTEEFKSTVSLVRAAAVGGTSREIAEELVATFVGGTLAKEDEVVEVVGSNAIGRYVVTDKRTYRLSGKPVVHVGDKVKAGAALSDVCEFCTPAEVAHKAQSLTISAALMNKAKEDKTLPNRDIPIDEFFDMVELLKETHELFKGQKTINPLLFALYNVFSANTVICVVSKDGQKRLTDDKRALIRKVMPPHTTVLFATRKEDQGVG